MVSTASISCSFVFTLVFALSFVSIANSADGYAFARVELHLRNVLSALLHHSIFVLHLMNDKGNYNLSIHKVLSKILSCSGCSLNRLPDVKQFIFEDLPQYDNVEFKHIPGAIPELVLFNIHEEEVERLVLSKLTREECNELLASKGFMKKSKENKDEM